jgi:hypothetical protein
MSLRLFVPVVGFVSLSILAAACTSDPSDGDGEGGAGGETSGPTTNAGAGAGGADVGAGGGCAEDGTGTLTIEVTGLPDGVTPEITITGPDTSGAAGAGSLDSVSAGAYQITAARVFDEDPIVRTVFDASVTGGSFCLLDGDARTVTIDYAAIPSSNKLWMPSGKDDELVGYSSSDIAETVMVDASVAIDTVAGFSVAFDKDGNLWTINPTIGEDQLKRIPASELGESGTLEADISISVPEVGCFVHFKSIAFDPQGNLWLSACEDRLLRLNAEDLTTSGDKEADVLFTEVINNAGLAFDKAGNLWVAGGPTVVRFDADRLELSDTDAPDLSLSVISATNADVLGAEQLAFDKAGNLWGIAGSTIFQLASSELDATGEQEAKSNVSFTIDVAALPGTPAFDESDGLWVDLAEGQFGRFSPAQLGTSKPNGDPVTPEVLITSASVSTTLSVAFFPAPQGLPLYHSIPAE